MKERAGGRIAAWMMRTVVALEFEDTAPAESGYWHAVVTFVCGHSQVAKFPWSMNVIDAMNIDQKCLECALRLNPSRKMSSGRSIRL